MVEGRKHIRLAETGLGLGLAVVGHFLHMPAHGVPARERLGAIDIWLSGRSMMGWRSTRGEAERRPVW